MIDDEQIDNMLLPEYGVHKENHAERYIEHFLEQYRIYLHVFNGTSERRQKANEFFLGLNTAIMAFLGYIEVKQDAAIPHAPMVFTLVPLVGVAICYCWFEIICSFKQLNRAKFKVIHRLERKLPAKMFETEWELLGRGKDRTKYNALSNIEKKIPLMFVILYLVIFFANFPPYALVGLFH